MTARFLVGDVHDRMGELEDGTYDLIITSPPFLALRSYLPDGHPDKAKEIGSEATPAAFLDVMLALSAEWGRLLAPHGSIAVEIGDTYSGSGGAGGDYNPDGLRAGQPGFTGSASASRDALRDANAAHWRQKNADKDGWPLAKSLAMIPELYAASLAYGRNLLTGQPSPAGRWRVRNFKPWIRSNPPVGALGDKERPATSYITVACRNTDRYFDLDAVRTTPSGNSHGGGTWTTQGGDAANVGEIAKTIANPAGAPPLDWWHQIDALIDHIIDERAGKTNGAPGGPGTSAVAGGGVGGQGHMGQRFAGGSADDKNLTTGARGVHIRRALETAGHLTTLDALDVSPKGYAGAHYAVWPPLLVKLLLQEMCPRRVCTTCGKPSRRIVDAKRITDADDSTRTKSHAKANGRSGFTQDAPEVGWQYERTTTGWSDCGHGDTWRPARILDPFAGSGTTLAVATGMGYDADGIDIDERNADLARERVGMFLTVTDRPIRTETVA